MKRINVDNFAGMQNIVSYVIKESDGRVLACKAGQPPQWQKANEVVGECYFIGSIRGEGKLIFRDTFTTDIKPGNYLIYITPGKIGYHHTQPITSIEEGFIPEDADLIELLNNQSITYIP